MRDHTRSMPRWLPLLVVAAACLPYLPLVRDYFLQDDFGVVQLFIRRPYSLFPRWFTMPWTEDIWGYVPDEIRPFVALTYQLTGKWDPGRPELHHLFNIGLHAANALLVMAIARSVIGLAPWAAAFAGVVFALLPAQAESVVWVTGRVDSMPAFFYLAAFLAYARWRQGHGWHWYVSGLALFFVALFSKQNTITMVATLAVYDLCLLTPRQRGTLIQTAMAWVPFAALTAGYLLLRRAIFGQSLRPGLQTSHEIAGVALMMGRHVRRTMTGHLAALTPADIAMALVLAIVLVAIVVKLDAAARRRFALVFLAFGPIWFAIGVAPAALAGYESERHAYLASAGWAFMLAMIIERGHAALRVRALRRATIAVAAALVVLYSARLAPVLTSWHQAAVISEAGVLRLQQEAAAAPPGALVIVGLPRRNWEWASPFVLDTPFAPPGLLDRVRLITPWRLHCCGPGNWEVDTRRQLTRWLQTSPRPPVIALHYAPRDGSLSRVTNRDVPELDAILASMMQTRTVETLDGVILDVLDRIVAGHPAGPAPAPR